MKQLFSTLACLLVALSAAAVPASPVPQTVTQPDGTTVTLRLHGDEFYNFVTTLDGYTVARNDDGFYTYAQKVNGTLQPTAVVAHDEGQRTAAEAALLASTPRRLIDDRAVNSSKKARTRRNVIGGRIDYSNFKGLVVLVEFSDKSFTRSDANALFTDMVNKRNYTGYANEDGTPDVNGAYTGSVRDYFVDNSMGLFDPQFDVVGPVKMTSYKQKSGATSSHYLFRAVLQQISSQVNFSDYDIDKDGRVDMVYFIVAGLGAHTNPDMRDQYLWPYASSFGGGYISGYRFDRYACSTELYGTADYSMIDGIGTMCHEFSHCLGLPDLYDTNYEEDGQSHDPGDWDIMSGGSYNNNGRTPVGYSLYDRYAAGFIEPPVITAPGEYSLANFELSNQGFILPTPNNKEKFLLENRQKNGKWDTFLTGTGLLVARMDSTNASVWNDNTLNCDPSRNYYELLRASGSTSGSSAGDPFPGTAAMGILSNETTPSLKTWDGQDNALALTHITESDNVVTFNVVASDAITRLVEDFEAMPVTTSKNATGVQGNFVAWDFIKSNVTAPDETLRNGEHSAAMLQPGAISTAAPLNIKPYQLSFKVFNPTNVDAKLSVSTSADGTTWTDLGNVTSQVNAKTNTTLNFALTGVNSALYYRVIMGGGSKTKPIYIDDITFFYDEEITTLQGDVDGNGLVNGSDVTALYNHLLNNAATGGNADVDNNGVVNGSDVTALYNLLLK